ncbi:MAG: response regulator transcription factor [Actinobacteria bacterium]|nr:response regulator transcription factor [Actinomycetota bacterium]MDI6830183.1 response regulator transcription factor [Actinomycetota bacterium]
MDEITLAVVDDHEIARMGISRLLEKERGVRLVGEACNGEEALEIARALKPRVMLVDVKLPDISGIEVVRRLKNDPETRGVQAIILTVYDDLEIAAEAIRAGAIGYILKDCGKEQLVKAIQSAAEGVPLVASTITQKLVAVLQQQGGSLHLEDERRGVYEELTERESDILRLVAKGYSNKSIARELGITISTVKTHLRNIFRKLEVEDRAQVIIKAIKDGVI